MGVVVVLAGLLDLRLEVRLVFLCGLETLSGVIRLALGGRGCGVGLRHLLLCGRDLVVRQVVELHNRVSQVAAHACKLGT